jgi:lipoprotein-anchoring transpeptidase ErfK/SrfK
VKSEKRQFFYLVAATSVVAGSLFFGPIAQAATGLRSRLTLPHHHASSSPAARAQNVTFTIKLEDQLLAILKYLPVAFQPNQSAVPTTTTTVPSTTTTDPTSTSSTTSTTTTVPVVAAVADPTKLQSGSYVWRFRTLPGQLKQNWRVGVNNVILQGALMSFQLVHNLTTTGTMNSSTWHELVKAAEKDQVDPMAYNYVYVRQTLPELLKLYTNGKITYETYVNTGVSDAPTQSGTYPVYERFLTTTMSGVEPDGKPYSDPGIPWVSYFHGGDALHGFIRSDYGYPQSLGCVEMPFAHAAILFPHTPIGTLVTIQ